MLDSWTHLVSFFTLSKSFGESPFSSLLDQRSIWKQKQADLGRRIVYCGQPPWSYRTPLKWQGQKLKRNGGQVAKTLQNSKLSSVLGPLSKISRRDDWEQANLRFHFSDTCRLRPYATLWIYHSWFLSLLRTFKSFNGSYEVLKFTRYLFLSR